MTLQIYADTGFVERRNVDTRQEAMKRVTVHLFAGWRGLTAELVEDGEVVGYYEHGWQWEERR